MTGFGLSSSDLWSPPTSVTKEPQAGIIEGLPGSFFPMTPYESSPYPEYTAADLTPCHCTERDGWGFCKHTIPQACVGFEEAQTEDQQIWEQTAQAAMNEQPQLGGVPAPLTLGGTPLPPGAYRGWTWNHTPPKTPARATFPDMTAAVAPQAGATAAAIQKPRIFVEDWGSPMREGSTILYESESESDEVRIKKGGKTDSPLGFKARVAAAQQGRTWSRTQSAFMPKRPDHLRKTYGIVPCRSDGISKARVEALAERDIHKSPLKNKALNKGKGKAKEKSSKIRSSSSASRTLAIKARASPKGKVAHDALFSARGRGATRFSFSGIRNSPLRHASTSASGWQMRTIPESPDNDEDEGLEEPPSPCAGRGQVVFPFARRAASTCTSSPGQSERDDSLSESEDELDSGSEAGEPSPEKASSSKTRPMSRSERLSAGLTKEQRAELVWSMNYEKQGWLREQVEKQDKDFCRAIFEGLGKVEVSAEGSKRAKEEKPEDRWARAKPWQGVKMGKVNRPAGPSRSLWPEGMRRESERQVEAEEERMEDAPSSQDSPYDVAGRFYNKEEYEDEVVETEDRHDEGRVHLFSPGSATSDPPSTP